MSLTRWTLCRDAPDPISLIVIVSFWRFYCSPTFYKCLLQIIYQSFYLCTAVYIRFLCHTLKEPCCLSIQYPRLICDKTSSCMSKNHTPLWHPWRQCERFKSGLNATISFLYGDIFCWVAAPWWKRPGFDSNMLQLISAAFNSAQDKVVDILQKFWRLKSGTHLYKAMHCSAW